MYHIRQIFFVALALAALSALAQTPPVKKAAKPGQPVFADLENLTQTKPEVGGQKPEAGKLAPESGNQESKIKNQQSPALSVTNTALAAGSTNAVGTTPVDLSGYVPDDKYKLRVGDRISLQILEDRDAPKGLVVADSGEIDVPYVGRVLASDKTCKQLADELKARLEKEYYHRATVIISLDVANKLLGRIYVWGQVRAQGPMDILVNENLTAGKAILRAGGFGDFANKKRVKIVRGGGKEGAAKQSFELNMIDILEKGKTERDVVLQPDDFIIVPSRLINF
ncbi:MAG: polysaccharide biosynthesis/export family protein [Verrucomicrobiota bacterium]